MTARVVAADALKRIAADAGFHAAGVCALRPSDHAAFLQAWIDRGYHGGMAWLARPDAVRRRLHPETGFEGLRSALVVALHYDPRSDGSEEDASLGVFARYARGRDYHRVVKKKLLGVLREIEAALGTPLPLARAYVDTGPVLERELARRAGLGWFGRNTMLIHPRRGSWFFLGTLLLELDVEPDEPFERDHCGTCHACLDACPTGALLGRDDHGAPVMDARLCISYLTIEHRGSIPPALRPHIGNRVFGCDICNAVCPWNAQTTADGVDGAVVGKRRRQGGGLPVSADFDASHWAAPSLVSLMRMTRDEWDAFTRGRAIRRAGYGGLRRNVAVALGNRLRDDPDAEGVVDALRGALRDEDALVRGHAAWALGCTDAVRAREALADRLQIEGDPDVREELRAALAEANRPPWT